MNSKSTAQLIAIVGGSGAGKSWLAKQLCAEFGADALGVSLDDFYRDLSHLKPEDREQINFDHPDAIDWPLFEDSINHLRDGQTVTLPRYDFSTHTRVLSGELTNSRPLIFVEGLWLLWRPHVWWLVNLSLFLDCPESVRWQRRLTRDCQDRGRSVESVSRQFQTSVAPMHRDFVEFQKGRADLVIQQPTSAQDFERLVETVARLREESVLTSGSRRAEAVERINSPNTL